MQTQTRSQRQLGKAYRQFSRKRYTQLKNASQKMRESQIVQKIIRQWDVMPMLDKNKWIAMNQSDSPATPMKAEHILMKVNKANISNMKTTGKKKENEKDQAMVNQQVAEEEINIKQFDSNLLFPKQKSIKKNKTMLNSNDYMAFYRFYYQQLMKEHPHWTPNKTTIIIKLLWRKRKVELSRKAGNIKERITKRLSARMNFKKDKMKTGMEASKIMQIWKRLPMESRNLYNTDCQSVSKKECTLHLKSSPINEESVQNQFSFLRRK